MRRVCAVAVLASLSLITAGSAAAKDLRKENQFLEAVVGKKLVSGDTWLVITPDGKIDGVGRNNAKLTGAWVWNKRFFCRNVVVGQRAFPQDCLTVSIDGDQVQFTRNKGKGDAVVYTVSN
ncbi:hypothetical protein [Ruegeria sp. Ofav3-42]|uniref:hypothetical protein n=1 Tax=Ruegeria sp. Ofav3-42 TaxID=2917759 RepID=UPI001EF6B178|nr:hypothetical protein [Ruegeria sp. Ofav3-42]MCG7520205.1 hypothetical protein [Ruegeria sp. Ofav3-42]